MSIIIKLSFVCFFATSQAISLSDDHLEVSEALDEWPLSMIGFVYGGDVGYLWDRMEAEKKDLIYKSVFDQILLSNELTYDNYDEMLLEFTENHKPNEIVPKKQAK